MKILLLLSFLLGSQVWASWTASTYNIRNFDHDHVAGATNLAELGLNIKSFRSDVMTFVEVVNLPAFRSVIASTLPGHVIAHSSCGGFGKQKLAIVYNPKVFSFISVAEDMTFSGTSGGCGSLRPALLLNLQHKASKKFFMFAAIHLKAGGSPQAMQQRWKQYELLAQLVKKYQDQNLVMMGDFNTTGYNIRNEDYQQFEQLLTSSDLRTTSENLVCTSYWSGILGNGLHQSSVLDHIIVEDELVNSIQRVRLGSHCAKLACRDATPMELGVSYQTVSDHCPIQVTFK